LLLEIGYRQHEALTSVVREIWPSATLTFAKDFSGWYRVLQVTF